MPLLPLEPSLYPEDLLSSTPAAGPEAATWWVLHTRPRAEKALARQLLQRQASFFLPLYEKQWRSQRRLLRSYVPLFPGYVFLHGDSQARLVALETNLLARVLPVPDPGELHADLARVHHLLTSGVPVSPGDRLEPGTLVEIISGPLAGLEGKVTRSGKRLRFFVEVQFLQRSVSVEIESYMIRALPSRRPATVGP